MAVLPHHHDNNIEKNLDRIPGISDFETVSAIFKQLSDPIRLKIFWILCHYEECVINISALVDMSSPAVAHHLKLLKEGGLIESRKVGKEVYYKAVSSPAADALHHMIEIMMEISCPEEGGCHHNHSDDHDIIGHSHDNHHHFHAHHDEDSCPFRHDQVEVIEEIHKLITSHPEERYTIEELSRKFLINTSTLKSAFKDVYGQPIATYMKEYRMKLAMDLLKNTDNSIASVAAKAGYENQSKFTNAFKGYCGLLPTEYRNSFKDKGDN